MKMELFPLIQRHKMIDKTELRIGNWIQRKGARLMPIYKYQVIRLEETTLRLSHYPFEVDNGLAVGDLEYEDVEGIPLTKEILLKCGFENLTGNHFPDNFYGLRISGEMQLVIHADNKFIAELYFEKFEEFKIGATKITKSPDHLHQLQNLVFALTNKELIVKT